MSFRHYESTYNNEEDLVTYDTFNDSVQKLVDNIYKYPHVLYVKNFGENQNRVSFRNLQTIDGTAKSYFQYVDNCIDYFVENLGRCMHLLEREERMIRVLFASSGESLPRIRSAVMPSNSLLIGGTCIRTNELTNGSSIFNNKTRAKLLVESIFDDLNSRPLEYINIRARTFEKELKLNLIVHKEYKIDTLSKSSMLACFDTSGFIPSEYVDHSIIDVFAPKEDIYKIFELNIGSNNLEGWMAPRDSIYFQPRWRAFIEEVQNYLISNNLTRAHFTYSLSFK